MSLGLREHWEKVLGALKKVIPIYERFNHVFSFGLDAKYREECASKVRGSLVLDAGAGPGLMAKAVICNGLAKHIVLLDPLPEMLRLSKHILGNTCMVSRVAGVFEALPFREEVFSSIVCSFSLRDARDMVYALKEFRRIALRGGRLIILDVGKPDNRLLSSLASIYWRGVLPFMALVFSLRYWRNYLVFYETYRRLPRNSTLAKLLRLIFGETICRWRLGGIVATCISIKTLEAGGIRRAGGHSSSQRPRRTSTR